MQGGGGLGPGAKGGGREGQEHRHMHGSDVHKRPGVPNQCVKAAHVQDGGANKRQNKTR